MTGAEVAQRVLTIVLQAVIALVVTASIMPFVLVTVPQARDPTIGVATVGLLATTSFVVAWLVWPRKRR